MFPHTILVVLLNFFHHFRSLVQSILSISATTNRTPVHSPPQRYRSHRSDGYLVSPHDPSKGEQRQKNLLHPMLLLMVQKSQTTTVWIFKKKKLVNNEINYQPQLVNAGFLNHQQYYSNSSPKSSKVTLGSVRFELQKNI